MYTSLPLYGDVEAPRTDVHASLDTVEEPEQSCNNSIGSYGVEATVVKPSVDSEWFADRR